MIAWAIGCVEAIALRKFGRSVGFYAIWITMGSFLFLATIIGWLLKQSDEQFGSTKLPSKTDAFSYGMFYIHIAVLKLVGKFAQSGNWYLYWSQRFVLTSTIGFVTVMAGQMIFENKKKLLRFIGFV